MASTLIRNNVHQSGNPDGRPIVFAHGFGCDQDMWSRVAPAFADDYRIVLFDHIGFGGSDRSAWDPQRHGDLQTYADDLLEILEELQLRDVVLVGHSVAAMIAVLAAVRSPERFGDLVLVGPSARYLDDPSTGYRGGFSAADIDGLLDSVESNYLGWSTAMAPVIVGTGNDAALGAELTSSFCRADPQVAALFARATFRSDNRADLPHVSVPTLILQCADDLIAPDQVGVYVAENIPGSVLVRLQATGHCPNLSAPAETVQVIRAYLAGRRRDG